MKKIQLVDCDFEIFFSNNDEIQYIEKILPKNYYLEDRRDRGWGYVITINTQSINDDLSVNIDRFLSPLIENVKILSILKHGTLRLGVYHKTLSYTIKLNSSLMLKIANVFLGFQVSLYPSE